ncbi:MAG: DUF3068 domain-containing protein [Corynebacterium sp.]|nr:DUF3068 domain-containing protein [Corynebacterium sp.]
MLPTSRILSALCAALASFLLSAGGLYLVWGDTGLKFPIDGTETTFRLNAEHAEYLNPLTQEVESGPVTKQLHYTVVAPYDESTASVRVGYSLLRTDDAEAQTDIQRALRAGILTYSFDRATGAISSDMRISDQLALPASDVAVEGYWLKFPRDAAQANYAVFDITSRSMVTAEYQDTEMVDGREIHHYRQTIPATNLAGAYPAHANSISIPLENRETGLIEVSADLYHMGTRDWFVDAQTGMVVNIAEDLTDFYATDPDTPIVPSLIFSGQFSDADQAALLQQAANIHSGATERTWAKVALIAGTVLWIVSLLGAFGKLPRQRRRMSVED